VIDTARKRALPSLQCGVSSTHKVHEPATSKETSMIHLAIISLRDALISFSGWALRRGSIKRRQSVPSLTSPSCRFVPFRAPVRDIGELVLQARRAPAHLLTARRRVGTKTDLAGELPQLARVGQAESSDWWLGPVPLRLSNRASMGCQRKPRAEPCRTLSPQPGNSESIAVICSTRR
jgi:hypothetical protein